MLRSRIAAIGVLGLVAVVSAGIPLTGQANGKHPHSGATAHVHAPVPAEYRTVTPRPDLWTNPAMLARGQMLYQGSTKTSAPSVTAARAAETGRPPRASP